MNLKIIALKPASAALREMGRVSNQSAAEETVREVRDAGGLAIALQGDVAVINAGIVAPSLRLADMDSTRLKRVFDVNVYGAYLCARESARRLSRARGTEAIVWLLDDGASYTTGAILEVTGGR